MAGASCSNDRRHLGDEDDGHTPLIHFPTPKSWQGHMQLLLATVILLSGTRYHAPRRRLDETRAARNPILRWLPPQTVPQAAE